MTAPLRALRAIAALTAKLPGSRRLLESDIIHRMKVRAGREVTAQKAIEIATSLSDGSIRYWVAGGWGVDALVGRQTRQHGDLDVVVDEATPDRIADVLKTHGLDLVATEQSIPPMPTVWVFSDNAGTTVEVLPIDRTQPPFDAANAFTTGTIANTSVPCVSATTQRALRVGYQQRQIDRDDIAALDGMT